ncbi:hypothetical protein BDN72DRAFT_895705 [Pluteus cervinus]|uniref:Uncharacterized protein n=1 Tax=Pluteus cervinus TaxID=181527 RepID=A0ACD3AZB5_9AGAR|nr:hypothetical protein BDN72DRAFT_895705 [Pluteus cervinus]
MQFLPFSLSYLILTPRQVRLPGDPSSPRSRDRRGSKDSSGGNTTSTAGTSRSMSRSATSASSSRWSSRFRRALHLNTYKSASTTSVPPVEASPPTLPHLPPPPIASTSYSHARSMSHPEVLESMVGGIPFPSLDSRDELNHHRRHFSHDYDQYHYHRVAGEFGHLPTQRNNEMSLIDAAATAIAVASIGRVVEDIGRGHRPVDDEDEEEDYGTEITPMGYAI